MSEKALKKLRVALAALQKQQTFPTIRKIAKTASLFIKKTIAKQKKKKLRYSKPTQKIPVSVTDPFIKHERDAFRMKAFSLLTSHGIVTDSISQKLDWLKNAPVNRIVNTESQEVILLQILSPFPGEKFELKGSFKRSKRGEHIAPIAGSFQLHKCSEITGFPMSCQHTGWALHPKYLSEDLHPLMIDVKKRLAQGTKERENVMHWMEKKREAFNRNAEHFLKLQQKLMEAIAGGPHDCICNFFAWVLEQENPYDCFSSVNDNKEHEFSKFMTNFYHANVEKCAEGQLNAFVKLLLNPIPLCAKEHLEELINSDLNKILTKNNIVK